MATISVVYVEAKVGYVQPLAISLKEATGEPRVDFPNMHITPEVAEQLARARSIASSFLSQPYVRPIAAHTLEEGTLLVQPADQVPPEAVVYDEGSFGLAFLAGCLALGLEVPLRSGRLFTAKLEKSNSAAGCPGGLVYLGTVGKLNKKLAAAAQKRNESLFLYTDSEHELLEFEQAYWRADEPWSCLPRYLPSSVPVAAVAASALDLHGLLKRCSGPEPFAPFTLLMLYAAGELPDGLAYTAGIGRSIARLRAREALRNPQQFQALAEALGLRGPVGGEHLVMSLLPYALRACTSDEMIADLVVAAICEEPFIADRCLDDEGVPSPQWLSAFEKWVSKPAPSNLWQLSFVLTIIQNAVRLIADFDTYERSCRTLVLRGLQNELARVTECLRGGKLAEACQYIDQLRSMEIGQRLLRINPDWIDEPASVVASWASSIPVGRSGDLDRRVESLKAQFDGCAPLPTVKILRERIEQSMRLTFRIGHANELEEIRAKFRPPLQIVNDLTLRVTGPTSLDVTIPSPVMLLENSLSEPPFSWSPGAALADDTFSRYPLADAQAIRYWFGRPLPGNYICFECGKDDDAPAGVLWNSSANPWPPAIDSQLLAASMVRHGSHQQPRRVLDIGTGTGYLAVVAAHVWPTIEELHLLDVDPGSLRTAELNVQHDARAGKMLVKSYLRPFQRFVTNGFDISVCCPPYLPQRPLPIGGIELATNNTLLLEDVVRRGASVTRELWLAFSSIAWHEFCGALVASGNTWQRMDVLERNVVPFRITWLFPRENEPERVIKQKIEYFETILMPRGLIDLNNRPASWLEFLEAYTPDVPDAAIKEKCDCAGEGVLEQRLNSMAADSRGFRFWHEVRVVRLTSAIASATGS